MAKLSKKLVVVAVTVLGMASVAMAEKVQIGQPGGVQIMGNTNITGRTGDINTTASGSSSTATTKVGGISGGTQIMGNTTISASTKDINTTASGSGSKACTEVGNVGDTAGCAK
jgi:hypothetical protein